MNTYKRAHIFCKAKARRQCFFLVLCFHLVLGDVPGPCRYSVTKEHLLKIKQLIENQSQNGCSITYTFTERQSLSKICYVKAAFPQVLELLEIHFQYVPSADNYRYVSALKNLVFNIYSQKCVPEINEEIEENPVKFVKKYSSSLREALDKIKEVIQLYMELMIENNKPVDWNCEEEFAEDYPESTTELVQTTGFVSRKSENLMDSDSSSEQPVRDSKKSFQNEIQEGSPISYKIAFIMASVCGGLLLIITLCCFKEQKKLKALLHRSKVHEDQRLTLCNKDIERRQHRKTTGQSGFDSS